MKPSRTITEHITHLKSMRDLAVGERIRSWAGATGTVERVLPRGYVRVRWENGHVGRMAISNLERVS